jgi:hypothetical protein
MASNFFKFRNCFGLVALLTALLNISCSDDSTESGDGEFIIASVETLAFESVNVPDGATAAKIDGGDFITYIVQGFDEDGNTIVIAIPEYDGPGTYELGNINGEFSASGLFGNENGTWSSVVTGGSGTATITTDDDQETTGTFDFVGVNSNDESSNRTITNGSFRVQF